jgi:AcrR family transcriptional regulator
MPFSTEASSGVAPSDDASSVESVEASPGEVSSADVGWQGRALRRSLHSARARSIERSHRIVAAVRDLANEAGSASFTMAQVARRAGLSLKSVYRCFAGKDDLLLALLAEESRVGAEILAERIDAQTGADARLRTFVEGIFELLTHPGAVGYARVLIREQHRLSDDRPDELRSALSPLVALLAREVRGARAAGAIDPGDVDRAAETMFGIVLDGIADVTRGQGDPIETAGWVWGFCLYGLRRRPEVRVS